MNESKEGTDTLSSRAQCGAVQDLQPQRSGMGTRARGCAASEHSASQEITAPGSSRVPALGVTLYLWSP